MPYKVYKKNGYKVCKPGGKKCFSKKGLSKETAEDQQKALYASEAANESLHLCEETSVSSHLEFKNITFPSKNTAVSTYHYKSKKDSIDISLTYKLGKQFEDAEYSHTVIRDMNDIHSSGVKFQDPQSPELQQFAKSKNIDLSSEDIEMAGQDAFDKIESHYTDPAETGESYEESLEFEKLFAKVFANEKK
jgi:hypothetical protein